MAKQTAVEWLYTKLSTCTSDEMVGNINNWFEEAKIMEKEQIMDAIVNNQNGLLRRKTVLEAEQYYNETYGTEQSTK